VSRRVAPEEELMYVAKVMWSYHRLTGPSAPFGVNHNVIVTSHHYLLKASAHT